MSKTPEELAAEWYWKNLTDQPSEVLLTNPPKYPADPRKAFLAGYQAAAPQWISVKERLPKLWNDYLAFGYGPTIPASCFVAVYDPKSNKWYDMHTDWDWSDVITHWQELPEPPKEEK